MMALSSFLLLLAHLAIAVVALRHTLCARSALPVRGVDMVAASRNTVLIVVFMPLQCATCHRQLKRLSFMSTNLSDVRVVVLAPNYEAPVTISRVQNEFPRLIIDRDVDQVWRTYEASNHDQIVFDRCGRVAQMLSHPRSDMTSYRDTLDAIDRVRDHAPCGPCNGGGQEVRSGDGSQREERLRSADSRRYMDRARPTFTIRANYNSRGIMKSDETSRRQSQIEYQSWNAYQNPYQTTTTTRPTTTTTVSTATFPQWKRPVYSSTHQLDPYRGAYAAPTAMSNPTEVKRDQYQDQRFNTVLPTPRATTSTPKQQSGSASHQIYGPDEDYEDDLLPPITTTPALQTQIPTPTSFDPLWPTPAPGQFYYGDPRHPKKLDPRYTKFGEQASENNIPCSAYTDDICYQQQEKLGREGLSKCCIRGIYLTDVCVPGKCSNNTLQLCCFQKFLQARYRCCEDDSQALGPASTMDFSKCCHKYFVTEDDCCNAEIASNYWRSVHEVCYPNTKVDFSNIKMEVRFAEGVRVVDLNENRVWDYECRNGVNRTQYAYIPEPVP